MVAQTPPTRFTLDPTRVEEFLQDISSFDMCFRDVASKWGTTIGGLALFITSEDGLQTIATAELAAALRIRLTALNLLPSVVEALGYIVVEYSREERRIPLENSLRRIRLLELKRRNAHRAGTLIFKLAHFNPKPIKSYTVRSNPPPTPPGGTAVALDSRDLAHESHACAEPQACHTDETSQVGDTVDVSCAQTCGMPKRPLGHGEASDFAPVPPVRRASGATGALDTAATDNAIASASLRATEIDGSASISVQAEQDAPSTSTSDSTESASDSSDESAFRSPQDCSQRTGYEASLRGAHPQTPSQEHWTPQGSSPPQTSDPPSSDSGP